MGCWEFCDPSSILFLLPTDLGIYPWDVCYLITLCTLCMNVLEMSGKVGRYAIRRRKYQKKEDKTVSKP